MRPTYCDGGESALYAIPHKSPLTWLTFPLPFHHCTRPHVHLGSASHIHGVDPEISAIWKIFLVQITYRSYIKMKGNAVNFPVIFDSLMQIWSALVSFL